MSFTDMFHRRTGNDLTDKKIVKDASSKKQDSCYSLSSLFKQNLPLNKKLIDRLIKESQEGKDFFVQMNESRVELATTSFDDSMKKALFEILYLLHVNEASLKEWKYEKKEGNKTVSAVADLYVENAPCGVKEITNLSPIIKKDFENYILEVFEKKVFPATTPFPPIESIFSIGSIGTVGHKNIASDLDLEIQYNIEPFWIDITNWSNEEFQKALQDEYNFYVAQFHHNIKKKNPKIQLKELKQSSIKNAKNHIRKIYPCLFEQFFNKKKDYLKELQQTNNIKLQYELIKEVIRLTKRKLKIDFRKEIKEKEKLLKQRIAKIQAYIESKYPEAEVYLFPLALEDLKQGIFSSTVDFKESSGEAYQKILSYDTLMTCIHFTPVIPSHFLFPSEFNNDEVRFERFIDYLRFGLMDFYNQYTEKLTHQGPTPDLSLEYVGKHYICIFWEGFKVSSGNLPKATLNLLRYEMLLAKKVCKTIIQLVKTPNALNKLVPKKISSESKRECHFHPRAVLQLEEKFPLLSADPWWLRYKALKIAFGLPTIIPDITEEERIQISQIIDLAFSLHIRISDVFIKPGNVRKFTLHREQVLHELLEQAFPLNSERRARLHGVLIGNVYMVNQFENDLRLIFRKGVNRIQSKIAAMNIQEKQATQETEVWFQHYLKNFEPLPNMVKRTILNHLGVSHGKLQIGYIQNKGWFFRCIQKDPGVDKTQLDYSILKQLPTEFTLVENSKFLHGLMYCVINGYYGISNEGTLKESITQVEFDRKFANLGTKVDNDYAFIRPDQIRRIMKTVLKLFPPIKVNYMNYVNVKRKVQEVMIFLNLLKFGRLSILYRDNLDTNFIDVLDIPTFPETAEKFVKHGESMLQSNLLHTELKNFFHKKKIDINQIHLGTWINTNSYQTNHAAGKEAEKESELAKKFKQIILQTHR